MSVQMLQPKLLAGFGLRGRRGEFIPTLHRWASTATSRVEVPANVPEPRISSTQVAQFKRGPGGRSSFSGNVITVFGATGYVGPSIINHLARQGNQLIIAHRCDPYWVRELKVVGDLGQILFFPFNLHSDDSIRRAIKHSNVVVNMIGTRINTKNWPMEKTHVEGAARIARLAKESGVERLIHISAMGADPDYKPRFYKQSQFLKTKGLGELAVREHFPEATIIRPSIIYGEGDRWIRDWLSYWRKPPHSFVFSYKAGRDTFKMPIYLYDASLGISRAIMDPSAAGVTYEFVGPHCYRLDNLLRFMFAKARCIPMLGYHLTFHGWRYEPMHWMQATYASIASRIFRYDHPINYDWMEFCDASSDVLTGEPLIGELGVNRLAEFENAGGYWSFYYSFMRHIDEKHGEIEEPPLPIRSPPLHKNKAALRMEQITVEKKPFHQVSAQT